MHGDAFAAGLLAYDRNSRRWAAASGIALGIAAAARDTGAGVGPSAGEDRVTRVARDGVGGASAWSSAASALRLRTAVDMAAERGRGRGGEKERERGPELTVHGHLVNLSRVVYC